MTTASKKINNLWGNKNNGATKKCGMSIRNNV